MKTSSSSLSRMRLPIHIIALFLALPIVHAQLNSNSPPLLTMTYPMNGSRFVAPADLGVGVSVNDPEERVKRVEYFANTNQISASELDPWRFGLGNPVEVGEPWDFVPVGKYALTAVARGALGEYLGTSSPVSITVEFSCEQGIVIRPKVSDTVVFYPEFGLFGDPSNQDWWQSRQA